MDSPQELSWVIGYAAHRPQPATAAVYSATPEACCGCLRPRFAYDDDILITPTLPCTAFEVGHEVPPARKEKRWMTWSPYCYPFNFTQQPAASVPCGLSNGLPVGLQIVGRRHEDALVLRAAAAYEQAAGGLFVRTF